MKSFRKADESMTDKTEHLNAEGLASEAEVRFAIKLLQAAGYKFVFYYNSIDHFYHTPDTNLNNYDIRHLKPSEPEYTPTHAWISGIPPITLDLLTDVFNAMWENHNIRTYIHTEINLEPNTSIHVVIRDNNDNIAHDFTVKNVVRLIAEKEALRQLFEYLDKKKKAK